MRSEFLGALVLVCTAAVASPASALETGQCLPANQVRSVLAAEAQNPIVVGNQAGYGRSHALVFTSNKDGSRGYALRGDKPFGEQATTICIDSVFRDVKLNDFTKPGLPDWARINSDSKMVDAICIRERLGYQETCRPYLPSALAQESNGQRVAFGAIGTAINPRDKSVRTEQRLVLTLQASEEVGQLNAVTKDGASYMLSGYSNGKFTQHSERLVVPR